jgi:large subunit ribosomal protein L9
MKVILNKDLAPLGEEGDIKDVAKGYARNYLFPRGIAMPYTDRTVAILESRRGEIEERKEEKRKDALGLKEKLETLEMVLVMPAGANGRLYGAVTGQTVADELARQGFQIERKRIELPGNTFKSVGKYKITVKLYESAAAELALTVEGQPLKVETPSAPARRDRRRRDEAAPEDTQETAAEETTAAPEDVRETAPEDIQETASEETQETAPEDVQETASEDTQETASGDTQETASEETQETTSGETQETASEDIQETIPEETRETTPEETQETAPAEDPGIVGAVAEENVPESAPEPVPEKSAAEN